MKAVHFKQTGGPEVLEYVDVPDPIIGPTQVLVRADTIGVNMPEVMVRRGIYRWKPALPAIPGIEMSGYIEQVGDEVTSLQVGQRVYLCAREWEERLGCYAELVAAEESTVFPLDDGIDLEKAATLAGYQVAWHLLNTAPKGYQFDTVLVTAAAGGIGTGLVQLAKDMGKTVIGTVGSNEKAELARSVGCDTVINYRSQDLHEAIMDATDGVGVDLFLDPVFGERLPTLFKSLAPVGLLVSYGHLDEWPADLGDVFRAMRERSQWCPGLRLFSMHVYDDDRAARRVCMDDLLAKLKSGAIDPVIGDRLPLAEASRAHEMLQAGNSLGNLVMKP